MATNTVRPVRTLVIFGAVLLILLGLVALGGVWKPTLGLDLQGGTRITLQAQVSGGGDVTTEKLDQAKTIITSRVNGTMMATFVGPSVAPRSTMEDTGISRPSATKTRREAVGTKPGTRT